MAKLDHDASELASAADRLLGFVESGNWNAAKGQGREVLSLASKLFQRISAVADVLDAGYATAEVDRALKTVREKDVR